MKSLTAMLLFCIASVQATAEDPSLRYIREEPIEHLVDQVGRGVNVLYMGKTEGWYRFRFFIPSYVVGDVIVGSMEGGYRCKDLVLVPNEKTEADLSAGTLLRVLAVDPAKREVLLDVKSFGEALKKALQEMEKEGEPARPSNAG